MIYLAIGLLVLSGVGKAYMDASADGALATQLNKENTWRNKWKNGDPAQGEKFFGSSTIFVALSDFWHGAQFLFLNSLIIGTILFSQHSNFVWSVVASSVLPRLTFEVMYRLLRRQRSWSASMSGW